VQRVFREITTAIGLRTGVVRPRIHDLRHTFAVRTLIDWQRDGADINANLPVLSTYLGHVEPSSTQIYIRAAGHHIREAVHALPVRGMLRGTR
jgi:integrase